MAYDPELSKVLMTLSTLAYVGEDALPNEALADQQNRIAGKLTAELGNPNYATAGAWQLVWGPGLTVGNMMYVARQTGTNNYALAIRGTYWKFIIDWVEDADVLLMVSFPYIHDTTDPNIRIAKGTMDGLSALTGMTGVSSRSPQPITLLQFLNDEAIVANGNINVYVTGHSLGGCLASVAGPWLESHTGQWGHTGNTAVKVGVYTYAGPSAGNSSYSNYCNQKIQDFYRVFNDLDVVPRAWQEIDVPTHWYVPAPECPFLVKVAEGGLKVVIDHDRYTVSGEPQELVSSVNSSYEDTFWQQLGYQHSQNTYLTLLGCPPGQLIDLNATAVNRAATGPNSFAQKLAKLNPTRGA